MKTNSGKIFEVMFTDRTESDGVKYSTYVYATCEKHARLILQAHEPDAEIYNVEEFNDCISEHYT